MKLPFPAPLSEKEKIRQEVVDSFVKEYIIPSRKIFDEIAINAYNKKRLPLLYKLYQLITFRRLRVRCTLCGAINYINTFWVDVAVAIRDDKPCYASRRCKTITCYNTIHKEKITLTDRIWIKICYKFKRLFGYD